MGVGGCMSCIKYCLFVFNLFFWLIGCALVGVGIWIVVDAKKFFTIFTENTTTDIQSTMGATNEETVKVLGIVTIIIGGIILILGFLGCCGAIRESQAMLAIFFTFLLLLFLAMVAAGVLAFVFGDKVKGWLRDALNEEARKNINNGLLVYANNKYDCCGIDDVPGGICTQTYPPFDKCMAGGMHCGKGCFEPLWTGFNDAKLGLGIALLVSGGVTVFGMIFALCLCCAIKNSPYD